MKQTDEDRRFGRRFADALEPFISKERTKHRTLADIAGQLGVTAAGLQKQLAGGTPSIRTVALAYTIYGVSVPYESIEVARAISSKRKKKKQHRPPEEQLFLPFEITVPHRSRKMGVRLVSRSVRRYE